jgi:hypothetical protein
MARRCRVGHALVGEIQDQLRDPARLALLIAGVPYRHLCAGARRPVGCHRLGDASGDRGGEGVGGVDDAGAAAPVGGDLKCSDVRVSVGEGHEVGDLGTAPLGIWPGVVTDDAELNRGAVQQLDEPFRGGLTS